MKRLPAVLLLTCLAWLNMPGYAADRYQLEKVVEISRHGVRSPTPDARKEIESATQRRWPQWQTADGELTDRGYAAAVNTGRWQGEHYRRLGLLRAGCPDAQQVYVRASPLQRTRATARALIAGAFPGCYVVIHHVVDKPDPLFQSEKLPFSHIDPAQAFSAVAAQAGDLAALQQRLQPAVTQLEQAVCAGHCRIFARPWQLRLSKNGSPYIQGLSVMASMVETLRLGWSENLPPDQIAWGHITSAKQIEALLPLLTANDDLSNNVPLIAQKRGSVLLDAVIKSLENRPGTPDTRWLLLVAHDTNIAMVRTLIAFSWQLPGYARGNIPPGSSLVFERWRDTHSNTHLLHVYFQAQSLDNLRQLRPVNRQYPLLQAEWRQPGCHATSVGTLCPYQSTLQQWRNALDPQALGTVEYPHPSQKIKM